MIPGVPYGSYKICVDNRNNLGVSGAMPRRTATVQDASTR